MSIKYDVYELPFITGEEEKGKLYGRAVNVGTITTQELEKEIEYGTSLTQGDVKNVIASLNRLMIRYLSTGKRIHIEGLGYFQVSIDSPLVKEAKDLRGDHLKVKTIKFLPEKKLKQQLATVKFERTKKKKYSDNPSAETIEKLLTDYFQEHTYITRKVFQSISGLTRNTAINRINKMIKEGKLIKGGVKGSPVYEWKGEKTVNPY